jgi:hypothetical protein
VIGYPFEIQEHALARRANTLDPILAELRAQIGLRLRDTRVIPPRDAERRRTPRQRSQRSVRLRVGDLSVRGTIYDVAVGGVFLKTDLLLEVGERGTLALLHENGVLIGEEVPVRVIWISSIAQPSGAGIGLAFELKDPAGERRALEMVLDALEDAR